ncbi:MAG: flagellar basal body protein FliL [Treponema sp.]|nr:flagellar basal body protein FliL [Treponema sp.]
MAVVFLVLALIYLGGTAWALFGRKESGEPKARTSGEDRVFTGIGRLRLSTGDPQPATVVVSVAFLYVPEDRAFSEELASRVGNFRSLTAGYFKSLGAAELKLKDEERIKAELLEKYNSILRLGKISGLYFNDFLIIE